VTPITAARVSTRNQSGYSACLAGAREIFMWLKVLGGIAMLLFAI